MKRVKLFSLLAAMAALSFAACGEQEKPTQPTEDEEEQVEGEAVCGDGKWQKSEECDGNLGLTGKTCGEGVEGKVKCTACKLDYSDCKGVMKMGDDYVATYHYDLSGIVPNAVYTAGKILDDPATELSKIAVDEAWKLIEDQLSSAVASTAASLGLKDLVQEVVKNAVSDYVGYVDANTDARLPAIITASEAVNAVTGMIKDFEVVSNMKVAGDADALKVTENWESIAFNWSYKCKEDCVQFLPVADMNLADGNNLNSEYTAVFNADHDQFTFEGRDFTMQYGTILSYVYRNVAIPAVTGDNNARNGEALLNNLIEPEALAQKICDKDRIDDGNGNKVWGDDGNHDSWDTGYKIGVEIKIPKAVFVTLFKTVTKFAGEKMDGYLDGVFQIGAVHMTSEGAFTTADSDTNWVVDQLNDGVITGKINAEVPTNSDKSGTMDMKATASAVLK